MVDNVPIIKHKNDMGTNSFKCSILIFIFLLINSIWLALTILNVDLIENGINALKNYSIVLIAIMISQMYRFQEEWTNYMGQVRRICPHLNSE